MYPRSTSDTAIFAAVCIHQLESGDMILADKDFVMQDRFPPTPFLKHIKFTKAEGSLTTMLEPIFA